MRIIVAGLVALVSAGAAQNTAPQANSAVWPAGSRLSAYAPSGALAPLLNRVRAVPSVEYRVGYGDEPGEFFRLSRRLLAAGEAADFEAMLRDADAKVRVMGAICLAQVVDRQAYVAATAGLAEDAEEVTVTNGCVRSARRTVGGLMREITSGRFFRHGEAEWGISRATPRAGGAFDWPRTSVD